MALSKVGFFRELRHGSSDGPSIRASESDSAQPDEVRIVEYLNGGATLAATGSVVDDALDTSKKAVAPLEIATDGRWVWPRDLAYYVREYHLALPQAFIEDMRARFWNPPRLSQDDLLRIENEFLSS